MRHIDTIIVHCAATLPTWMKGASVEAKVVEIERWHKARGFGGKHVRPFGYHFLIDRDGAIGIGRPLSANGAHARGHNARSIGICLVGGLNSNENDQFLDHFTTEQDKALRDLIEQLCEQFPSIITIAGHNQYSPKACPGFNVPKWHQKRPAIFKAPSAAAGPKPGPKPGLLASIKRLLRR